MDIQIDRYLVIQINSQIESQIDRYIETHIDLDSYMDRQIERDAVHTNLALLDQGVDHLPLDEMEDIQIVIQIDRK